MAEKEFKVVIDKRQIPGTQVEKDGVYFGVYTEGTEVPSLILYEKASREIAAEITFPENELADRFYSMKVKLQPSKYDYNFRIGETVAVDPYAKRIVGKKAFGETPDMEKHSIRSAFPNERFDWKGDKLPQIPWDEVIMYHLHVRGFTMQKNSGARHKGSFQGMKEKIPYLKELGVNQVKLMPIYEFDEMVSEVTVDPKPLSVITQQEAIRQAFSKPSRQPGWKMNYWGYGSAFYFAPKAAYAAGAHPEIELKELVRSLHSAGIEVILEFCFTDDADFSLIANCLTYWAYEYHIDGFSVMARDSVVAELAGLPIFSSRKLICTWYPEHIKNQNAKVKHNQIAESNDGFMNDSRRALRGDEEYLQAFAYRLRNNDLNCPQINYMTNHDGFTMVDMVTYEQKCNQENGEQNRDGSDYNCSWNCGEEGPSRKKSVRALRIQQQKNAYAMLLFSQGVPMLLAGDEFSNSQNGNNNPYCHDSELTWLSWGLQRSNKELQRFVKDAIAFRKNQKVLHQNRTLACSDQLSSGFPDISYHGSQAWYGASAPGQRHIGCMYSRKYVQEEGFLYIAYNFNHTKQEFALPKLQNNQVWHKVMDTSLKDSFLSESIDLCPDVRTIEAEPHSIIILEGK